MSRHHVSIRPRRRSPLDVLFMGGCGEIGMNLTLYGSEDRWIAIDCGMMIHQELPGSPLQVPDVEALRQRGITPSALVVTHGHEDHIGAIVWLWPRWGCPIWASPLAAAMLRHRFSQHGLDTGAIQVFQPGDAFEIEPFGVRTLGVTHSIPESCALLITVGKHRLLHTGDWKLDSQPLLGQRIDEALFRGLAPIDLVVGDSTNATVSGHSASEGSVAQALASAIAKCQGRVVVSCFASNLARIHAAGLAARGSNRRVVLAGRAMQRMVQIAKSCGYLEAFPLPVPLKDAGYLPREEVLLIATGSQGEPGAALSRMAQGRHMELELEAGDTVIFSSKIIPGNERAIASLVSALRRRQIEVMDESEHPELHASGHPARDELRTFYGWIKPRYLLPVHGTEEHQRAHLALAHELGIEGDISPRDGDWLRWDGQRVELETRLELAPRLIEQRRNDNRRDSRPVLALVLPVLHDESGWSRVGRLIVDPPLGVEIDEYVLSDWLDERLVDQQTRSTRELREFLLDALSHWLFDHGQRVARIHLDIVEVAR